MSKQNATQTFFCLRQELPQLPRDDENVATWVQIFPKGPVLKAKDKRVFKMSNAKYFVESFNALNKPILVDYDHLSYFDPDEGGNSKAAGWLTQLENRDDEIWGLVDWTPNARAAIRNGEYRYLSPEFKATQKDKNIITLDAVALVNRPAFSMAAVRASAQLQTGDTKMFGKISAALGLASDADESAILAAIEKRKGDYETQLASLQRQAQTPSIESFMPRKDYDVVLARAEKAETQLAAGQKAAFDQKVMGAIDGAVKAGKITPASKDHYVTLCHNEKSLEVFLAALDSTPKLLGETQIQGKPEMGNSKLTDAQKHMCSTMGISETDFIAQLAREGA